MLNISQLRLATLLFSLMAGIINIFGIKNLGLVVTNVTGHFSSMVDKEPGNLYFVWEILGCVLVYFLGSFFATACFMQGKNSNNRIVKAFAPISILIILIMALLIDTLPICHFFFVSSVQNAFASNHSQSEIKPSQITGVVMNAGYDLSNYFLGNETLKSKAAVIQSFIYKILNIIGFVLGVFIGFYIADKSVLIIPVIFYLIISILVIFKKF